MNFGLTLLALTIFSPLLGFLLILMMDGRSEKSIRWVSLVSSLVTFCLSLALLVNFNTASAGFQMEGDLNWIAIGGLNINFHIGVDGLGVLMVLLTTFLTPITILSTWSAVRERVKGFMMFFLLLEMGMLGVFASLDLILFYIFWEFTLIPMYFLIGVWGGENRVYAAVKFFLFTMAGSILMLLAIIFIGMTTGTFSLTDLMNRRELFAGAQMWLFIAFAAAFAIKVPMWPLHSWLPDAHTEAPTAGSVILAGVMLKMGAYGFLRFNLPLFPQAAIQAAPWMAGLAVIGIIYGGIVAYGQRDMKKLVAYSSVSHLGFVMLGIFALTAEGLSGAILQMVNHGLSTGALFLIVGMLYERSHTREMAAFGGLWKVLPVMGAIMLFVSLSSMGLPGLNGFVGEFTILLGAFGSPVLASPWFAGVATLGVIIAAVYLLFMFEKVFLGPVVHQANLSLKDISAREVITLAPILVLILWIGLYPAPFFALINPTANQLATLIQTATLALH
ncbi:MAG: NuoM family protein [Anaerolineaceae bacterium]